MLLRSRVRTTVAVEIRVVVKVLDAVALKAIVYLIAVIGVSVGICCISCSSGNGSIKTF